MNKKKLLILLFILSPYIYADIEFKGHLLKDFEQVMYIHPSRKVRYNNLKRFSKTAPLLRGFEQNYTNFLDHIQWQEEERIPKIIHQIWIGPAKKPERYPIWRSTWFEHHPDWYFIMWVDRPPKNTAALARTLPQLKTALSMPQAKGKLIYADIAMLNLQNKIFYDEATNPGEKSDILRYELLYQLGGLYIDIDCAAFKPFDIFNHCCDFYIGIHPLNTPKTLFLGMGLIGSKSHHPFLEIIIDEIKNYRDKDGVTKRTGPQFITNVIQKHNLFNKATNKDVFFPANYFYPVPKVVDESFSGHYFAGSWRRK